MRVLEQHNDEITNAFRGNTQLPAVHTIPSQHYSDPQSLFLYMYKKFFEHILLATNNRILVKVPDAEPITMRELQQYFCIDHLAHPGFIKSSHVRFSTWWPKIKDHAKLICGKTLNLTLSRNRFFFISKYLECGINVAMVDRKVKQGSRLVTKMRNGQPVKIHNLNDKIDPIIEILNQIWIKYKNPGEERSFCLDESFRKTYSPWDQFKSYLPSKPDKYGQKFQCIVDKDFYIHRLAFDHSQQFALWKGTLGLVDYMLPESYKYKGCTLTADNFYNTGASLRMLHKQGTALLGTMRKMSAGKIQGHEMVKKLTKSQPKKDFRRKFELFEQKLDENEFGTGQFIQLGYFSDKRDKCVIMCTNDARLFNTADQGHKSRILGPTEKPEMIKYYNNTKHYIDELDRMLSHYTCARAFKNGNPIRRLISNLWDYSMHNCFVLFRQFYQLPLNQGSKYAKMERDGLLRSEFYFQCLFGIIGYEHDLTPLPLNLHDLPTCGPFPVSKNCEIKEPRHEQRARTAYKCALCQKYICKRDQLMLCPYCYREKIL